MIPENPNGKFSLPSSEDFNDPPMGIVLHWHLQHCSRCDPDRKVFKFGQRSEAFCDEYWGIVAEYAEYEGHYAMVGNP